MSETADMSIVKLANYRCVWNYIHSHGVATIPQISQATGLSLPTVTRAVDYSVGEGIMCTHGIIGGERGRKAQAYSLNKDYIHFLFISLHCHRLYYQVHNFLSEVLDCGDFLTDDASSLNDVKGVIEKSLQKDPLIRIIGISITGTVDGGLIYESYDYPSLQGLNLKEILEKEYERIVFIENDLHAAVYAASGFLPQAERKIVISYLFGKDGYGSGILVNGELLRGSTGSAGKITNIVVTQKDRHSNKFYAEVLCSLSAVINPDTVVLYPGKKADSKKVQSLAFKDFKSQKVPDFVDGRDFTQDVFTGLKRICKHFLLESDSQKSVLKLNIK